MKKSFIVFFLLFSAIFVFGQEYKVETIPNPQQAKVYGFVSNPDKILKPETELTINQMIDSLWRQSGTEIAVVAVHSIGYDDIDDFANRLYNYWKIGQKRQQNGVLILMVEDVKKIVIRTGYGAEGILPDAIAKRIITQVILPEFKKGNYDAGMIAGVDRVIRILRKEPFVVEKPDAVNWKQSIPYAIGGYLLLILLVGLWLQNSIRKINSNKALTTNLARYKAIKEENKAIYSLTAWTIPFVALIAIILFARAAYVLFILPIPLVTLPVYWYGKWQMNRARKAPIVCNECGHTMHLLSEKEEDKKLQLSQQFEEKLGSVDYDVFVCDNCKNEAIFPMEKLDEYTHCPKCNTKAFALYSKKTIVSPTYINAGSEQVTYKCRFCGYEENQNNQLPRLRRNSGVYVGPIGGGFFSGRGGFGGDSGGGFGGGGFGGGMTGGGGASGGW